MKSPCVACGSSDIRRGFIPDAGDMMSNVVMAWYEGDPEQMRMLGMKTDNVKSDSPREPVVAYKCASCGFLHLYVE